VLKFQPAICAQYSTGDDSILWTSFLLYLQIPGR
jgi:hypothetical protein